MKIETFCDLLLQEAAASPNKRMELKPGHYLYDKISVSLLHPAISKLSDEGYARYDEIADGYYHIFLTDKGIAFAHTSTFEEENKVDKKEKWVKRNPLLFNALNSCVSAMIGVFIGWMASEATVSKKQLPQKEDIQRGSQKDAHTPLVADSNHFHPPGSGIK